MTDRACARSRQVDAEGIPGILALQVSHDHMAEHPLRIRASPFQVHAERWEPAQDHPDSARCPLGLSQSSQERRERELLPAAIVAEQMRLVVEKECAGRLSLR